MDRKILRKIVEDSAAVRGVEVCEVRYSPGKGLIDVVCDKPGGIGVEECEALNKELVTHLKGDAFPEAKITVSPPGLDRPIRTIDEFRRKILYSVRIKKKNGAKIEGKIVRVEKNNIFLEAPLEERVSVSEVETARILI
ncbi:MAG: hypothetical protein ABIJ15_03735 [bacterium]